MFDLVPRQMTRNGDFDGVGSLASRWILAVKLLERQLLRTSITLVVKAPLFYRQVLQEGRTSFFKRLCKRLVRSNLPWKFGLKISGLTSEKVSANLDGDSAKLRRRASPKVSSSS